MNGLKRKMRDTVTLYTFTADTYGTKTAVIVGTVKALLRTGQAISHTTTRVEETSDAQLWLDPSETAVSTRGGQVQGLIVKAQKANYLAGTSNEDWYEIRGQRVASDSLLGNRTAFIRCALQKIEPPATA